MSFVETQVRVERAESVARILGMSIAENESVPVGKVYSDLSGAYWLHPLDVLVLRNPRDPLGRLDAVAEYFTRRAHLALDRLLIDLAVTESAVADLREAEGALERLSDLISRGKVDDVDGYDRSLVLEDDDGWLCAAVPGSDTLWEAVDLTRPEHRVAVRASLRRGEYVAGSLEPIYETDERSAS